MIYLQSNILVSLCISQVADLLKHSTVLTYHYTCAMNNMIFLRWRAMTVHQTKNIHTTSTWMNAILPKLNEPCFPLQTWHYAQEIPSMWTAVILAKPIWFIAFFCSVISNLFRVVAKAPLDVRLASCSGTIANWLALASVARSFCVCPVGWKRRVNNAGEGEIY